jgi:hypothetical protein
MQVEFTDSKGKNGTWIKQKDSMHLGLTTLKDGCVTVAIKELLYESQWMYQA